MNRKQLNNKVKYCRVCNTKLTSKNWYQCNMNIHQYICISCELEKWHNYNKKHKKELKKRNTQIYRTSQETMHKLKINGCAICGYSECDAALDFHHVNPEEKNFCITIGKLARNSKSVTEELNKCILLCKNCHAKIHTKERSDIK